jgi:ABC-type lipoprotein release transport system permease subunit
MLLGIAGSLGATRVLQQMLYETAPTEPETFVAVVGFMSVVTLVACALPAWRAARVDHSEALRVE